MPCVEIFEKLRARGILIRHFNAPRISDYLRITIGTPEQMQRFFAALDEILGRINAAPTAQDTAPEGL